jgi:hypothetical protein
MPDLAHGLQGLLEQDVVPSAARGRQAPLPVRFIADLACGLQGLLQERAV